MLNIIEIKKDLLPYNFDIELAGEEFNLEIFYNKTADLFTVTLSKNDEVLVYNEPVIYGVELFKDVYVSGKFPKLTIIPYDESGESSVVTYNNMSVKVFLTIDDTPDGIEEAVI